VRAAGFKSRFKSLVDDPDDAAATGLDNISLVVDVSVPIFGLTGHLVNFDLRGKRFADHDLAVVDD
jgi:hypothetical protein